MKQLMGKLYFVGFFIYMV